MSRGRRRKKHEEEAESAERWLLTYADMITLLLALFIVLFSISTINQKKFLALAMGLKESFDPKPGILPSGQGLLNEPNLVQSPGSQMTDLHLPTTTTTTTTLPGKSTTYTTVPPAKLQTLQSQVNSALLSQGLRGDVSLQVDTRGLVVQILDDKVHFQTGSADLGPIGDEVVDSVASVLSLNNYDVAVEGYTDNAPLVGGPYGSNEVLSTVRAANVVLRLENTDHINPTRLSAIGYGDTHPVAPNDNPQDMALNRRIDIVILSTTEAQP